MIQLVSSLVSDPVYGTVEFPNQVMSSGLDAKAWIMITIIFLFVSLCILGIVVEFTSFGDKSRFTEDEIQQLKVEDRKSKLGLALYSFSPINNVKKLFTVSKRGDQSLVVLNGVRVLSAGWIVIGHSFEFSLYAPTVNLTNLSLLTEGTLFGIIPAGVFAVDTFFFISGLLTCYLLAIKMYPKKGATNFFLVYFHRYYRLIFPVLFVQGFAVCLIRYLGDGPIYRQTWDTLLKPCDKYWWPNLLFINNFIPWKLGDECINWVWYLANDFQFFLVTPPILYVFCKNRKIGYALFYLLLLGSMLFNGILYGVYNISINEDSDEIDVLNLMYIKPWARIGAYIIGCLFGLGIFELKMKEKHPELKNTLSNLFFDKLHHSRVLSIACAVVGTGLTALYVFPLGDANVNCRGKNCWPTFFSTLFGMTSRPFFVLGVGLIIAPTVVGRLRFLINLLGSETFTVLARLSYSNK